MALYTRLKESTSASTTEFDILKASHKFLRGNGEQATSWNDQLAVKYYSSLFREFAVCDLKHYKSGNFALRWRTEGEVLSGAGETTCANTRCEQHTLSDREESKMTPIVRLTTLELPFAYEEHGEMKSALVKVVLCPRCCKKLMWKRNKEKGPQVAGEWVSQRARKHDADLHAEEGNNQIPHDPEAPAHVRPEELSSTIITQLGDRVHDLERASPAPRQFIYRDNTSSLEYGSPRTCHASTI
ncbi:folate-sensitive fragile site protein Fra10Ac1-domain-containing protein [Vararia minispora EC-137]|uniref:Folate-sensitive fragile site protein Fra10Ac1-domain-containing protein n=1 Tax=Vararia minispora EC-137 TaxID=1314806 RepID=A0ACB8QC80_9AGAM|nr:folate-sensitive fragile site protein Fra10Ac1-domain-containing protein [Vararia minispora EC-137]